MIIIYSITKYKRVKIPIGKVKNEQTCLKNTKIIQSKHYNKNKTTQKTKIYIFLK
jgi:hypothetical protein